MTYDTEDLLQGFHVQQELGYPLLRDVDAQHVNQLGIRNEAYEQGHRAYGVPHPGILFVRPDGEVVAKFAVPGYRQRPPLDDVLAIVQQNTP